MKNCGEGWEMPPPTLGAQVNLAQALSLRHPSVFSSTSIRLGTLPCLGLGGRKAEVADE
jgi:hypothetical protein